MGYQAGHREEALEAFAEGVEIGDRAADVRSLALLYHHHAAVLTLSADPQRGLESALESARLGEGIDDPLLRARLATEVARARMWLGQWPEAVATAERALTALGRPRHELPRELWQLAYVRGQALHMLGDLEQALEQQSSLVTQSRERGAPGDQSNYLAARGWVRIALGDPERATDDALAARELAESASFTGTVAWADQVLGEACLLRGAWAEAVEALERAVPNAFGGLKPMVLEGLSRANLELGDEERARALADEAIAVNPVLAGTHVALSRVLLKTEGAAGCDDIRDALDRARGLADAAGARPWQAQVCEEYASLATLLGDDIEAERELREAHRLYTEMGAQGHVERMARDLEDLGSRFSE
jgi:tetratricopeptide (TPR) repeat protein